jgi:enoyl-CoA hydratase
MIHTDRRGAVALITIDRQERRNAVDHEALEQLTIAFGAVGDARAVVLTGAGGHFCAGADLTAVADESFSRVVRRTLDAVTHVSMPVIAAVDGAALGLGTQLAVACDLRVATPGATFGIPAGKLGLMVDHATVQRLALLAGHGLARAMLLAAETMDGDAAFRLGLVQRQGGLDDALAWAERIAELAPLTLAGHKVMLNRLEQQVGDDPAVAAAFSRAWASEDLREGIAAFGSRRAPIFHGR